MRNIGFIATLYALVCTSFLTRVVTKIYLLVHSLPLRHKLQCWNKYPKYLAVWDVLKSCIHSDSEPSDTANATVFLTSEDATWGHWRTAARRWWSFCLMNEIFLMSLVVARIALAELGLKLMVLQCFKTDA